MKLYSVIALASVVLVLFGRQTAPKTEAEKDTLKIEARSAISMFKVKDPGIRRFFDTAEGYAVIPTVGKGAIGVGGAYGRGLVYAGDTIHAVIEVAEARPSKSDPGRGVLVFRYDTYNQHDELVPIRGEVIPIVPDAANFYPDAPKARAKRLLARCQQ